VLDLFAGTGSFGIEALSRGASFAVFVEQDRAARRFLLANLARARLREKSLCLAWDARRALPRLASRGPFDIVFVDPPFAWGKMPDGQRRIGEMLLAAKAEGVLAPEGLLLLRLERRYAGPPPESWTIHLERAYGDSLVRILSPT
jgi:16S rRNA (guanine966-N2)-methyltransferase